MSLKLIALIISLALIYVMLKSRKLLIFSTVLFLLLTATRFGTVKNIMETFRWIPYIVFTFIFLSRLFEEKVLPRKIKNFDVVFFIIIIAMFLSAFYSINPEITVKRAATFPLLYISIFWVIYPKIQSKKDVEEIIDLTLLALFIPSALGILSIFLSSSAFLGGRFRGYFSNPNFVGLLSAIFIPLVLWEAMDKKKRWAKILLLIMVISALLSGSRNGLLASTIGAGYYIFMTRKKWRIPVVFLGIFFIILIYTVGGVIPSVLPSYLRITPESGSGGLTWDDISSGREEHWRIMWFLFKERPFTGYGFGTENLLFKHFGYALESTGGYTHNSFLGMAVQMGILGVILLFTPFFYLLFTPKDTDNDISLALRGMLIAGLIAAFFESWVYSIGSAFAFPYWLGAGLLIALRNKIPKDNESSD
jgi:O-antigen ligase